MNKKSETSAFLQEKMHTLVVVHPTSALHGPADKIAQMAREISEWDGPLFVLTGAEPNGMLGGAPADLMDALFRAEAEGHAVLVDAEEEGVGLEAGIESLVRLLPYGAVVHLTGAWRDECVATVDRALNAAGIVTTVLAHAVATDDEDPGCAISEAIETIRARGRGYR